MLLDLKINLVLQQLLFDCGKEIKRDSNGQNTRVFQVCCKEAFTKPRISQYVK